MATDFQTFRPFTIRCLVTAPRGVSIARCFAKLLDRSCEDMPPGSMLAKLAVEEDMPALPRYAVKKGAFIFEAYVTDDLTAEQAYDKLITELEHFGFVPVAGLP